MKYPKFKPYMDIEEGVFYDPKDRTAFTVSHYFEDDGELDDDSMAFIVGTFWLDGRSCARHDDAEWTGYHSVAELLEGEFTTDCYVLTNHGMEPASVSELHRDLLELAGVDLSEAMCRI